MDNSLLSVDAEDTVVSSVTASKESVAFAAKGNSYAHTHLPNNYNID